MICNLRNADTGFVKPVPTPIVNGWVGGWVPLVGRGGRESKQPVAVRWQGPNSDTQPGTAAVQFDKYKRTRDEIR